MAVRQTPSLIVSEIVKCRCSRVCVCVRFDLESTLLGLVVPVTTLCNVVDHLSCNLQIEPKGQDQVNCCQFTSSFYLWIGCRAIDCITQSVQIAVRKYDKAAVDVDYQRIV